MVKFLFGLKTGLNFLKLISQAKKR